MVRSFIFLGNPGSQYAGTRHNIGWMAADVLADALSLGWQGKFKGSFAQVTVNGESRFFLKPETYMNRSGESVELLSRFFKIDAEEMLVVHDEVELDFGIIDFKRGGGLGGHNGLRSISSRLGTREFLRLRMGVSKPAHGNVSGYVLGSFGEDEIPLLQRYIEKACEALLHCMNEGFDAAASLYTKKRVVTV